MNLQYQLSNGSWVDCGERTAEFLARCIALAGGDESAVSAKLAAGAIVRHRGDDWYANCRDGAVIAAARSNNVAPAKPILRCRCGNTGHAGDYPFSTLPGSGRCDDCV